MIKKHIMCIITVSGDPRGALDESFEALVEDQDNYWEETIKGALGKLLPDLDREVVVLSVAEETDSERV